MKCQRRRGRSRFSPELNGLPISNGLCRMRPIGTILLMFRPPLFFGMRHPAFAIELECSTLEMAIGSSGSAAPDRDDGRSIRFRRIRI